MGKENTIDYLELGNGFIIKDDKVKCVLSESKNNISSFDDAFDDIIRMAEIIDKYDEQREI